MGIRDHFDLARFQPRLYCWLGDTPASAFVLDPAIRLPDNSAWQRGPRVVEAAQDGEDRINNVVAWLDKRRYPNPWHFVAEASHRYVSVPIARDFPYHLLTPYKSLLIVIHARVIPKFPYELDHDMNDWECTKSTIDAVEIGGMTFPITRTSGWHTPDQPCTFALRDLSYIHSDFVLPNGIRKPHDRDYLWNLRFRYTATTKNKGISYEARFPASISYPANDKDAYAPGVFFAAPITHVQFHYDADRKEKDKAMDAGFVLMLSERNKEPLYKDIRRD